MRPDDLSDGSLKALLVLALVLANLVAAELRHPQKSAPPPRDAVAQLAAPSAGSPGPKRFASLGRQPFTEAPRAPSAALGTTAPTP